MRQMAEHMGIRHIYYSVLQVPTHPLTCCFLTMYSSCEKSKSWQSGRRGSRYRNRSSHLHTSHHKIGKAVRISNYISIHKLISQSLNDYLPSFHDKGLNLFHFRAHVFLPNTRLCDEHTQRVEVLLVTQITEHRSSKHSLGHFKFHIA